MDDLLVCEGTTIPAQLERVSHGFASPEDQVIRYVFGVQNEIKGLLVHLSHLLSRMGRYRKFFPMLSHTEIAKILLH